MTSLFLVQAARADDTLSVTCTNDGNGLYTYTISPGPDGTIWGMSDGNSFQIKSYGVLQTFQPAGWVSTVGADGWVVWMHPGSYAYIDQPTTFSILSSYKKSRYYGDQPYNTAPFPQGLLWGGIMIDPDFPVWETYTIFPIVGPDPDSIPALSLQIIGTNAVLSWPAEMTGYTVQSCPNAAARQRDWITLTNEPVIVGNRFCITNPISDKMLFYRLR